MVVFAKESGEVEIQVNEIVSAVKVCIKWIGLDLSGEKIYDDLGIGYGISRRWHNGAIHNDNRIG